VPTKCHVLLGSTRASYLGDPSLRSRLTDWLSWPRAVMVFLTLSKKMLGPFSKSLFTSQPVIQCSVTWAVDSVHTYTIFLFIYLVCETIGTAATPGILCQPRVIVKMIVEKQIECRLAGETEVLGENLPQHRFCPSQNPTGPDPGLNAGRRGGKPATNRLSYGAALHKP
jgi:hypothetical protein